MNQPLTKQAKRFFSHYNSENMIRKRKLFDGFYFVALKDEQYQRGGMNKVFPLEVHLILICYDLAHHPVDFCFVQRAG